MLDRTRGGSLRIGGGFCATATATVSDTNAAARRPVTIQVYSPVKMDHAKSTFDGTGSVVSRCGSLRGAVSRRAGSSPSRQPRVQGGRHLHAVRPGPFPPRPDRADRDTVASLQGA